MEENEERSMIEPKSFENPKLKDLIRVLMDWINDELHTERIIVQVMYIVCPIPRLGLQIFKIFGILRNTRVVLFLFLLD